MVAKGVAIYDEGCSAIYLPDQALDEHGLTLKASDNKRKAFQKYIGQIGDSTATRQFLSDYGEGYGLHNPWGGALPITTRSNRPEPDQTSLGFGLGVGSGSGSPDHEEVTVTARPNDETPEDAPAAPPAPPSEPAVEAPPSGLRLRAAAVADTQRPMPIDPAERADEFAQRWAKGVAKVQGGAVNKPRGSPFGDFIAFLADNPELGEAHDWAADGEAFARFARASGKPCRIWEYMEWVAGGRPDPKPRGRPAPVMQRKWGGQRAFQEAEEL